ncbi:MAG: hypothetical protein ISP56_00630 [Flavobacteriaceae bacterium]|nr:hypothetical protein [Flavobacteriaceae bacterium]
MKKFTFIISFLLIAFIFSCENTDQEMTDDELIQAIIESENRISVTKEDLPQSTITSLNFDVPNDVIRSAELAPNLGFEIELKSWNFFEFELDFERDDNKYFTTKGRKLESTKGIKGVKKKRESCFKFVYPISYTMSDNSVISGNSRKEIHTQMKAYFDKNGKSRENKPTLNLPIQILITSKDKTVSTKEISTLGDLKLLWQYCKNNKGNKGDDKRG